jgi:hypothetical protein
MSISRTKRLNSKRLIFIPPGLNLKGLCFAMRCVYIFRVLTQTNSHNFPQRHKMIQLLNGDYFLWGKKWSYVTDNIVVTSKGIQAGLSLNKWSDMKCSDVGWTDVIYVKLFYFEVKWSEVGYGEVLVDKGAMYIRVTLYWGYLIILWLFRLGISCIVFVLNSYCGGFILFCNVWVSVCMCGFCNVCVGFVMCGWFGNM